MRMKVSTEAKVGMMVTISFTIFIILVAVLAKFSVSSNGYQVRIYYSFLNDLRVGASVKVGGGIKIGEVKEIKQSGEKTEVVVWIDKQYRLPKSSTFAIFTTGMIGEKYINCVVPAIRGNEGFIEDGEVRYGIDPASFDKMMQTFQSFLTDKDGGQILADIFQNSSRFVETLNNIALENRYDIKTSVTMTKTTITELSVQTRVFMNELNVLTKNLSDITKANKEDITIALRNLSETTASMNKILYRIENGKGTIGKLMTDEEIYNNLRDASIYAKDFTYILKQNPSLILYGNQPSSK